MLRHSTLMIRLWLLALIIYLYFLFKVALDDLKTNKKLQIMIPHLVTFCSSQVITFVSNSTKLWVNFQSFQTKLKYEDMKMKHPERNVCGHEYENNCIKKPNFFVVIKIGKFCQRWFWEWLIFKIFVELILWTRLIHRKKFPHKFRSQIICTLKVVTFVIILWLFLNETLQK